MKESDLCVIAVVYGVATWFLVMTLQLPPAAQSYPLILLTALYLCNTLFLGKQLYSFYRHRVVLMTSENCSPVSCPDSFSASWLAALFIWP